MKVDFLYILEKLFASYHVDVQVIKKPYLHSDFANFQKRNFQNIDLEKVIQKFIQNMSLNSLIVIKDFLGIQYALFILPDSFDCIMIGPFRYKNLQLINNKFSNYGFNEQVINNLEYYLNNTPIVDEELISVNLVSIVSTIYPSDKFEVKYIVENQPSNIIPKSVSLEKRQKDKADVMKTIEHRYDIENQFLMAISKGDATLATILIKKMYSPESASRFIMSLRSQKNSLIIFNTLLRKAIENANIHPYYIDEISARFSNKIELVSNEKEYFDLMAMMIHEYCDCVHKYSNQQYSPLIQQVIHYMNVNLSKEITLDELSKLVNVNSSYLSSQFKNETGTTIINYLNHQKIKYASYLLKNTQMSISSVAMNIGIIDANYFARLFKKYMGVSPRVYRKSSMLE